METSKPYTYTTAVSLVSSRTLDVLHTEETSAILRRHLLLTKTRTLRASGAQQECSRAGASLPSAFAHQHRRG